MTTVILLLDAFSGQYVSKEIAPGLFELAQKGIFYPQVKQSAGYCERSEVTTGHSSQMNGYLTAIGLNKRNNQFSRFHRALVILGKLEKIISVLGLQIVTSRLRKFLFLVFKRLSQNITLKPYNIPLGILSYFELTEDKYELWESISPNGQNIFQQITESGNRYSIELFTSLRNEKELSTSEKLSSLEKMLKSNYHGAIFVYIADTDIIAHKYGTKSDELRSAIKNLDAKIARLVSSNQKNARFVIFGDHGMLDIETTMDIGKIVHEKAKTFKLKHRKDYLLFLDSTIFRLWFIRKSPEIDQFYADIMSEEVFLMNGEFEVASKNSFGQEYGDLRWYASAGVLIYPDYFQGRTPYRAMHGYETVDEAHMGMCIVYGSGVEPKREKAIPLYEIYNVILSNVRGLR